MRNWATNFNPRSFYRDNSSVINQDDNFKYSSLREIRFFLLMVWWILQEYVLIILFSARSDIFNGILLELLNRRIKLKFVFLLRNLVPPLCHYYMRSSRSMSHIFLVFYRASNKSWYNQRKGNSSKDQRKAYNRTNCSLRS